MNYVNLIRTGKFFSWKEFYENVEKRTLTKVLVNGYVPLNTVLMVKELGRTK